MKKELFFLIFLIIIGAPLYAQIGIKGGANPSSVRSDRYDNSFNVGFHIGGFYDIRLSERIYLQPQLLFMYEPYTRELPEKNDDKIVYEDKSKSYSLSLPILASYRYPIGNTQNISIDMGIFLACGLFGKVEAKLWENNILTENIKTDLYTNNRDILDTGFMGGLSYTYNQFILSGHVKYGITKVNSQDRTISYLFSVGYRFKK